MKISHIAAIVGLSVTLATPAFASKGVGETISDSAITAKIKTQLAADNATHSANVKVTTNHGVVVITGEVNSETEASEIVQIAEATHGVNDVDSNNLTIKGSDHPFSDTAITAKVKGVFLKEKLFGKADVAAMSIHVETKDGPVYLSGNADNEAQAQNASRLAKTVKGVRAVENSVKVDDKKVVNG